MRSASAAAPAARDLELDEFLTETLGVSMDDLDETTDAEQIDLRMEALVTKKVNEGLAAYLETLGHITKRLVTTSDLQTTFLWGDMFLSKLLLGTAFEICLF